MSKVITTDCRTPKDLVDKHSELLLECLNYYRSSHPELTAIISIVEERKTPFSPSQLSLVQTAAYNYASVCKHNMRATYLHIAVIFDPRAESFLCSDI